MNALNNISNLRTSLFQNTNSKMIKKQFIEDFVITFYLFICVFLSPKDENYEPECKLGLGAIVASYFTYVQIPMFLLVSFSFYIVRSDAHQGRHTSHNFQKAVRIVVIKYLWLIIGITWWTC